MQKTITIKNVELVKTGISQKTGRTWTLFKVTDETGTIYTTFSNAYQNKIGEKIDIDYEEQTKEVNGVVYKNLVIVSREKGQAEQRHEELKKILKAIYDKIKNIETHLIK